MDLISVTAQSTVIVLFFAGVFNYVILTPLNKSIKTLQTTINEINKDAKEREEKRIAMDLRLVKCEESTRTAHHRIDHLENEMERVK